MATLLIAGTLAFSLRSFGWFEDTLKDPLWRWPLFLTLLSGAALLTYLTEGLWRLLKQKADQRRRRSKREERLKDLSKKEKEIFRYFLGPGSRAVQLRTSPEAEGLTVEGLLIVISKPDFGVANYRISDEAIRFLRANPRLLD